MKDADFFTYNDLPARTLDRLLWHKVEVMRRGGGKKAV